MINLKNKFFVFLFFCFSGLGQAKIYSGSFIKKIPEAKKSYSVISYNIKYGNKLDQIIDYFEKRKNLKNEIDFILLQEVMGDVKSEENQARRMAKRLNLAYFYVPSTIKKDKNQNFGVAILSRYPARNFSSFLLPHQGIGESYFKEVLQVNFSLGHQELSLTNTHNHPRLFNYQRFDQAEKIFEESERYHNAIIAGDFNTFSKKNRKDIIERGKNFGFIDAQKDKEWTFKNYVFFKMRLDLMFSKGINIHESAVFRHIKLSDHRPLYMKFSIQ